MMLTTLVASCTEDNLDKFGSFENMTPTIVEDGSDLEFDDEAVKMKFGKKGVGVTFRNIGDPKGGTIDKNMPKVKMLNVDWNYSWGVTYPCGYEGNYEFCNQPDYMEYVPLFFGGGGDIETTLPLLKKQIDAGKLYRVLSANEPDKEDQSNVPVEKCLERYQGLQALGIPIGSPAVAAHPVTSEWFKAFWAGVEERGYRVDYICVHNYGGASFEAFVSKMTSIYNTYKRPLLITEMAVADWSAKSVSDNQYSPKQVMDFMKKVLPWMEATDWIAGYAWFPFGITSAVGWSSAFFDNNGALTELGQYYADFEGGDDDYVKPDTSEDGFGENLVKNGGFESDPHISDWNNSGDKLWFIGTDDIDELRGQVIADDYTLIIEGAGEISQTVAVEPSKNYDYGFTSRTLVTMGKNEASDAAAPVKLTIFSGDGTTILGSKTVTKNANEKPSGSFTLPANYAYESVTIKITKSGESGYGYVDEVRFREITDYTKVESITIPETFVIDETQTKDIEATAVLPIDASNKSLKWEIVADADGCITITESGEITGVKAGTATIKALATDDSGKESNVCTVTVNGAKLVTKITIPAVANTTLNTISPITLSVEAFEPTDASNKGIEWSVVEGDDIISIDSKTGKVTPLKPGEATVVATAIDGSAVESNECRVIVGVEAAENLVKGGSFDDYLDLAAAAAHWIYGDKSKTALEFELKNVVTGTKSMRFTTANAAVNMKQLISAPLEVGETYKLGMRGRIADGFAASGAGATAKGYKLSISLRVGPFANNAVIAGASAVTGSATDTNVEVTFTVPSSYSSTNENYLYINKTGGVAFFDDVYLEKVMESSSSDVVEAESIAIAPATLALKAGESSNSLSATITPANATYHSVTWSVSEGDDFAKIDANTGVVTALAEGTAKIVATAVDGSGVKSNECVVTVTAGAVVVIPLSSITLSDAVTTVDSSEPQTIGYTIEPLDATDCVKFTYMLTDLAPEGCASVDPSTGVVAATAAGTGTLKVTAYDAADAELKSDDLALTFTAAPQPSDYIGVNLVVNPDFEEAGHTTGWTASKENVVYDTKSDYVVSGNGSTRFSNAAANKWGAIYQLVKLPVKGGATYKFGMKGRVSAAHALSGGADPTGGQKVTLSLSSGKNIYGKIDVTTATDKSVEGTIVVDDSYPDAIYIKAEKYFGIAYVDDFYFELVSLGADE